MLKIDIDWIFWLLNTNLMSNYTDSMKYKSSVINYRKTFFNSSFELKSLIKLTSNSKILVRQNLTIDEIVGNCPFYCGIYHTYRYHIHVCTSSLSNFVSTTAYWLSTFLFANILFPFRHFFSIERNIYRKLILRDIYFKWKHE